MKKLFCLLAIAFFSLSAVSAQDYNWGVGVRFGGGTGGAAVKYKFNTNSAVECLLAGYWTNGFAITGLYERHVPIIDRGFHFYYGAGGHIGSWKKDFSLGVDAIVGLEYKFGNLPLALSLDYKPAFNIIEKTKFQWKDLALGLKITF